MGNNVGIVGSLVLLLFLWRGTPVTGLYFPQSELTVRLPYLARNRGELTSDLKLLALRTLRNNSDLSKHANYRISSAAHEKMASIDSTDSEESWLLLQTLPTEAGDAGAIVVSARENGSGEAVLEIKVQAVRVAGKEINCTDYVQDMCFWNTSRYRIYENQPTTMIGKFGPDLYAEICPDFRVTRYELLNGTKFFHLVDDKLFANASLDRDSIGPPGGPGPKIYLQVSCVVWERTTGIQHVPIQTVSVDVLDQDDNPPFIQGTDSVAITLHSFTAGDRLDENNNLIVKDADAKSTNQYSVRILGDTHNALNVTYDTLPIEHPQYPDKAPSTMIFPRIYSRTTLLPESPYRVILQVKDESLLPGHGEDTLNITLTFSGPEHRTTTTTASSVLVRQTISYPSSVKVPRAASRFFRVAKPISEPHKSITFAIYGSRAFNITPNGGIVYVVDENLLKTESRVVQLELKWSGSDGTISSKMLRVNLTTAKLEACSQVDWANYSCANSETRSDCESRCGTASGSFSKGTLSQSCVWRLNKRSNISQMSEQYPTCSPDLSYCPDNKCDPLERLEPRICPQDCASEVHFAQTNKGGVGIHSGMGTCTCNDALQCTCNVDHFSEGNNNNNNKSTRRKADLENEVLISGARKASSGPCGTSCMIGVIGASIFVLMVIIGCCVTWRYRMANKGSRRECKRRADGDTNGLAILPSDYIDRGDGLLIGLDTFTAANRHLLIPKTYPPDPKWEFPRSRLTIEQVLGEGEFGRVLRAKAVDIASIPGPTTVAVKTLKETACASELADLLSEYQLLKEAQHPNVIRLLGACTTAGGPVYLIIEFAEFGSLRNYLRRSRHLECEGRMPCSTSLLSASANNVREELRAVELSMAYTVTPRDILSFAWQISKGMAYLADIKLVHRDLAARNVLLASGKVCKISDFGLTRDVYEDDAYLKRSKGRVPVKWMAPESLADHVYTSKSDVWSFGVLLWELVTLGASPYPGVDVHNLYNLLKAGYRMERPANCSPQLYKLMISCWHQEPAMRPSFKELTCHWERMLEDGVEYLDLNPRTVHNQAYFASLHALDSPNSSGNEGTEESALDTPRTDVVNYLGKPCPDAVTKCDKVDKLQELWQEPVASFPDETTKMTYVNDRPANGNINHYESPIKFRNTSVTSNSENDLNVTSKPRPQSYIDMEGKKPMETDDLLVFGSTDSRAGDDDDGN